MDSQHNYSMHILLMNKKRWDGLSPEQQQIITEAAREALVWQRNESVKLEEKAWQAFRDKYNFSQFIPPISLTLSIHEKHNHT